MIDQIRIIEATNDLSDKTDRHAYVIAKAAGAILNLALSPYNPRIEY
jgi:hypothetical protein